MDKSTFVGILLAVGGIVVGLFLEGGKLTQIVQPTAALIVFGGTLGAVMVQFPLSVVMQAFRRLGLIFFSRNSDASLLIADMVRFANKARREGIVAIDDDLPKIQDDYLRRLLTMAVDGAEPQELRKIVELELDNKAEREEHIARVFESAGGFAPTIGIIGAVLGLIQVMQHLENIDEVGRGIAVAFVATVYGVGSANLFFLPSAGKLKIRLREEQILREMTLEGVISILEGENPRTVETKLCGYLAEHQQKRSTERSSVA